MNEQKQRELASKIFPEIKDVILDKNNCYFQIFEAIINNNLKDRIYKLKDIPCEWAYFWVLRFSEDRDEMRQFVTEAKWAYNWACKFPEDKDEMKPFVIGSHWAYYWVIRFPEDKEKMKQFITE